MKNSDKLLLLVGIIVIIGGLFIYSSNNNTEECLRPNEEVGVNEITYKEYACLLSDEKIDIVYIGSSECGYCSQYKPVLEAVTAEYGISAYYVDIIEISDAEYNKLIKSNSYFKDTPEWGTPTTFILEGNKVVDVISGATDETTLIDWFKKNDIISEE